MSKHNDKLSCTTIPISLLSTITPKPRSSTTNGQFDECQLKRYVMSSSKFEYHLLPECEVVQFCLLFDNFLKSSAASVLPFPPLAMPIISE